MVLVLKCFKATVHKRATSDSPVIIFVLFSEENCYEVGVFDQPLQKYKWFKNNWLSIKKRIRNVWYTNYFKAFNCNLNWLKISGLNGVFKFFCLTYKYLICWIHEFFWLFASFCCAFDSLLLSNVGN